MPEASDSEDGDQIARPRTAVAQGVVSRDPGTEHRRGFRGRELRRHRNECLERSQHVLRISPVVCNPWNLAPLAGKKISAPARGAMAAVSTVPADAHTRARLPVRHIRADGIDQPDDFMPRNSWELEARICSLLGERIAVADTAGLHAEADLTATWLRDCALNHLKRRIGPRNLNDSHPWHDRLR